MKNISNRDDKEVENSRIRADRISKIREFYCSGSNEKFSQILKVSKQYSSGLCTAGERITEKTLEKILTAFPDVSRLWLYFGEGDMLVKQGADHSEERSVGGGGVDRGVQTSGVVDELRYIVELQREHIELQREHIEMLKREVESLKEANRRLTERVDEIEAEIANRTVL